VAGVGNGTVKSHFMENEYPRRMRTLVMLLRNTQNRHRLCPQPPPCRMTGAWP
jgi:hypothetical protein